MLFKRTLDAAHRSAIAAEEAVKSAREATHAARQDAAIALAASERMGRTELRAYSSVVRASIRTDMSPEFWVEIEYLNSGASPARSLSVEAEMGILFENGEKIFLTDNDYFVELPSGRSEVEILSFRAKTVDNAVDFLGRAGRTSVKLRILLKYQDVFANWQRDRFSFRGVMEEGQRLPEIRLRRQPNRISESD